LPQNEFEVNQTLPPLPAVLHLRRAGGVTTLRWPSTGPLVGGVWSIRQRGNGVYTANIVLYLGSAIALPMIFDY
jgi:hypothetical protein